MQATNRATEIRGSNRSKPCFRSHLYFTAHELAAACVIGMAWFSIEALRNGEGHYWLLTVDCGAILLLTVLWLRRWR